MSGGLFGGLGISASGMAAERLRMDVIAENLANADTTRGPNGQPYQRKQVLLEQGGNAGSVPGNGTFQDALDGVQVAGITEDSSPPRRVYDPGHPDADAQGYVSLPNVEPVTEMVDLITASRGYEANVQALQASKQMFTRTLDILR
jgi:flagellar basal-body rod protein FlgC